MRNLTIKRTKSFVGCLVKMKIYIEDSTSNETFINNTPCRKIGELKNGEEKTFQIGEQEAKVYVIADQLSKNYCNEFYQLPEGQEDIFLSGKNRFNPANGNAFRFDNNENEEARLNRKSGTKKGLLILIIAIIAGAIIGYSLTSGFISNTMPDIKTFSSNGMSITLTDEFIEDGYNNFTVSYKSENVIVAVLKESFDLMEGVENYTLEQYANIVIKSNNIDTLGLKTVDGLTFYEYNSVSQETQNNYRNFSFVYKTDDAFWLLQFVTLNENADDYFQKIVEWAKSVEFSGR